MEQPKPLRVVAGLIYREGKLLICQRQKSAVFSLKWEFPGGKIEPGETPTDALRRELKEELDIDAGDVVEIYRHEHIYDPGPRVSLIFFFVREFVGNPKNLAFEQIYWSDLSELLHFDFLAGDQPLICRLVTDNGADLLSYVPPRSNR